MKILFIIPYYAPAYSYGGPVKVAHDLAKEFVKKGHSVTVATTDVHDAHSRNSIKTEEIDGVKIVRFRNLSNYLAKNFNGYLPFGFRKWIKENLKNYNIVHCHDFFTYQNIVVSRYCKKLNIPFVVQPHGCLDALKVKVKSSKFKFLFLKFFPILQNAKAVIALTGYEKASIVSVLNFIPSFSCHSCGGRNLSLGKFEKKPNDNSFNKIQIIPNGVDLAEFQNIQKIDLHKKYNLSPETKLLFYFGRVQHIKGIDFVIKTFKKLCHPEVVEGSHSKRQTPNSQPPYHLFIVGPDEDGEKARLEKIIRELNLKKQITFVGQLNGEEKKSFLASCDLFLFFSRGEGLPMTALEISALGIPSMLSKECFVPEIAQAGGGYEVEKENFEENAGLIMKHFEDETKIKEMQKNGQKVIKDKFELDVVVGKMLELY